MIVMKTILQYLRKCLEIEIKSFVGFYLIYYFSNIFYRIEAVNPIRRQYFYSQL